VRWLLDEMLPPTTAEHLTERGHDAVSVYDVGLAGADDPEVFSHAVAADRVVVTENFADYSLLLSQRLSSDQACVPVVFVHKSDFPEGGALAVHLAAHLDAWAAANPQPYGGPHWPHRGGSTPER
jgi:hypothetical protein